MSAPMPPELAVVNAVLAPAPTTELTLPIEGMTCASCALHVEKALMALPGVDHVAVNLATEAATLRTSEAVPAPALTGAVQRAGYQVPVRRLELQVGGVTCASYVARVEKALLMMPGVAKASVNLATERASVDVLGAVSLAGYSLANRHK